MKYVIAALLLILAGTYYLSQRPMKLGADALVTSKNGSYYTVIDGKNTRLTLANIIAREACWSSFSNGTDKIIEEMATTTYTKMGEKDGEKFNPKKTGYEWVMSWCGTKYDTPSGFLDVGYYEDRGAVIYLNRGGMIEEAYRPVLKSKIVPQ